jgi:hypothetical protein
LNLQDYRFGSKYPEDSKSTKQTKILSVCQEIVYGEDFGARITGREYRMFCAT